MEISKKTSGTIDAPIARNPKRTQKNRQSVESGKAAVTHFKVLEQYPNYALVSCQLVTGRTHQIRVHMKYIGHPLAGDPLYGPKKTLKGHGQFLHAKILGFNNLKLVNGLNFKLNHQKFSRKSLLYLRRLEGIGYR